MNDESNFIFNQRVRPYVLNLDIDNTCADYSGGIKKVIMDANPHLNESDFPPLNDYCFVESKWPTLATIDDYQKNHVEGVNNDFLSTLQPYENCVDSLNELHDSGVYIRVVTHRLFLRGLHQKTVVSTAKWLDDNNIPYDELVLGKYKSDFVADALVEDSPKNIIDWRETYGTIDRRPCFVYAQSYNEDFSRDDRYYARNWEQMKTLILKHKERIGK